MGDGDAMEVVSEAPAAPALAVPPTPGTAPPVDEQLAKVNQYHALDEGDTWYPVSQRWKRKWEAYCRDPATAPPPGPVDNDDIMSSTEQTLSTFSMENIDFAFLHESQWNLLVQWYGALQPGMPRKVIRVQGGRGSTLQIETHPLRFNVFLSNRRDEPKQIVLSKTRTYADVLRLACEALDVPDPSHARLWTYFGGSKDRIVRDMDRPLSEDVFNTANGARDLMVEVQDENGNWQEQENLFTVASTEEPLTSYIENGASSEAATPSKFPGQGYVLGRDTAGTSTGAYKDTFTLSSPPDAVTTSAFSSSAYTSSSLYGREPRQATVPPGVTGLNNLGNTCFMNSALQCLNNTPHLVEYFLSGRHLDEINRTNVLGMGGEVAEAFGALVKQLWSGYHSSVAPRDIKYVIGRFAPQFMGYAQHDSQELLAFLLDGLHEDLNRILKRPYASEMETENLSDQEAAARAWDYHHSRNDSVIVDVFQGQFRSQVTCPECKKAWGVSVQVSVTYDPYMYLSLPLPGKPRHTVSVRFAFLDPAKPPTEVAVPISRFHSRASDLRKQLADVVKVDVAKIALVRLGEFRAASNVEDSEYVDTYNWKRLLGFELAAPLPEPPSVSAFKPRAVGFSLGPSDATAPVDGEAAEAAGGADESGGSAKTPFSLVFALQTPGRNNLAAGIALHAVVPTSAPKLSELEAAAQNALRALWPSVPEPGAAMEADKEGDADKEGEADGPVPFELTLKDTYNGALPADADGVVDWRSGHVCLAEISEAAFNAYLGANAVDDFQRRFAAMDTGEERDVTIYTCLNLFRKEEQLGQDDTWYCPKCKEHRQAYKKMDVWRLPDVLVIHLKRFSYTSYLRDKIDTLVSFPLEKVVGSAASRGLDLTSVELGPQRSPPLYDLFAVSNHFGGLGGGHYTAYAKNYKNGKWYHFDDSYATETDASAVQSEAAYVLFYVRRGTDPTAVAKAAASARAANGVNGAGPAAAEDGDASTASMDSSDVLAPPGNTNAAWDAATTAAESAENAAPPPYDETIA